MSARASFSVLLGIAAAAAVLWLADRLLQPLPVAAVTATLGGLLGLARVRGHRARRVTAGLAAGLLAGAAHHLWVHVSGHSTAPEEGLILHLLAETGVGLGVAIAALAAFAGGRRLP